MNKRLGRKLRVRPFRETLSVKNFWEQNQKINAYDRKNTLNNTTLHHLFFKRNVIFHALHCEMKEERKYTKWKGVRGHVRFMIIDLSLRKSLADAICCVNISAGCSLDFMYTRTTVLDVMAS